MAKSTTGLRLFHCLYFFVMKLRQGCRVINKSEFLDLGVNIEGQKELIGMWLAILAVLPKWAMPLMD